MITTLLSLFNAFVIDPKEIPQGVKRAEQELYLDLLKHGIFVDPNIALLPSKDQYIIMKLLKDTRSLSALEINSTLISQWNKVEGMSDVEFAIQQLAHYANIDFLLTKNSNQSLVIKPIDQTNIESFKSEVSRMFVQIKAITPAELETMIINLISSGVAIKPEHIPGLIDAVKLYGFKIDPAIIKNEQFAILFGSRLNLVPTTATRLLRTILYKAASEQDETYLELNNSKRSKYFIERASQAMLLSQLLAFKENHGIEPLAAVFNRFKPLFLSMKHVDETDPDSKQVTTLVNQIRRKSKTHHKPMPKDPLAYASSLSKEELPNEKFSKVVKNKTSFLLIRTINALELMKRRNNTERVVVYRLPHNVHYKHLKPEDTNINIKNVSLDTINERISIMKLELISRLQDKFKESDVAVVLPKQATIALPASTKKFVGSLPIYTSIEYQESDQPIIGVVWEHNIDIDLSAEVLGGVSIGWNRNHRYESDVFFSGDMTRTNKHGFASELIKTSHNIASPILFSAVLYSDNYSTSTNDYKIFAGVYSKSDEKIIHDPRQLKSMMDISDIRMVTTAIAKNKSENIGILLPKTQDKPLRFGLTSEIMPNHTNVADNNLQQMIINDLSDKIDSALKLDKTFIEAIGLNVIEDPSDVSPDTTVLDFSLDVVSVDTFINLLN